MIPIAHRRADDLRGVRIRTCAAFGLAFGLSAGLAEPLRADDDAGPILSAVNLAGSAMDYDGIAFAADDGIATGRTGEEGAGGNDGPNGTQTGLVGTPFASVRWGPEVSYSVAAPSGASTLDLYFMEGWWPDAGRRLMDIEIEGQIVREGFDIVEASDGDFDTPQVLRFTGIDPTISGDPNRIELRVIARRDTAVLSAVVLRCEDTAEACAAKVAEAEADRAAAAAAAPQIVDQDESLNVVNGGSVEVRLTNLDPNESYWVTLVPEDLPVGR
jgi:Di-glucose binding within endoplasmic reticulum.